MPNRLAGESSPYLLQHANNPVQWYPWCDDAWQLARSNDKPVFLSVGYSACHWCHVMEHESFENQQIADYLNEHFVAIKVDREERPDIDQIYMAAVMSMQGHGGWPLSAFLTPDQDFFFGGTYWPPTHRALMPGFDRVLASVVDAWHNKRTDLVAQSKQITQMIQGRDRGEAIDRPNVIDGSLLHAAVRTLANRFDPKWGGFGDAPKFPHPMDLSLLLRLIDNPLTDPESFPRQTMLQMVNVTLNRMAMGGIHDHLAGGFARYSVDERWLVPHFEKMLYDNALLARVYLNAFRATGNEYFRSVCSSTLDYLLNDMTDPEGGIYSTEDADSEGEEGKFYVWSAAEIRQLLDETTAKLFCKLYDVTANGNFEGQNILNLRQSLEEFAVANALDLETFSKQMHEARQQLLSVRNKRIRPGLDDKIITSWNGMAIEALVDAAITGDRQHYAVAAQQAGEFAWNNLRNSRGRLLHTWRQGQAKLGAYLDDYAWMTSAFLSLYRIDFDPIWIERSKSLADDMIKHFLDEDSGSFFYTADDHESLIVRTTDQQDAAVPSGNSMAAFACLRLGRMSADLNMEQLGHTTIAAAMPFVRRVPLAASQMLVAIHSWLADNQQFVLAGGKNDNENASAISLLQQIVPLEGTLVYMAPGKYLAEAIGDWVAEKKSLDGKCTLYCCQQFHCAMPLIGLDAIVAHFDSRNLMR